MCTNMFQLFFSRKMFLMCVRIVRNSTNIFLNWTLHKYKYMSYKYRYLIRVSNTDTSFKKRVRISYSLDDDHLYL